MKKINYFKFGLVAVVVSSITACSGSTSNSRPFVRFLIDNESAYNVKITGANNNNKYWFKFPNGDYYGSHNKESIKKLDKKLNSRVAAGIHTVNIPKKHNWSFEYMAHLVGFPLNIGSDSKLILNDSYWATVEFASSPAKCFTFGVVGSTVGNIDYEGDYEKRKNNHSGIKDIRNIYNYIFDRKMTDDMYNADRTAHHIHYHHYKITDEMYNQATDCE